MKTERRHKLETNELADSLAHWVESVKPYVRTIMGLLIAAVVLAFAYAFVSRHSAAKAREGWDEYFQAFNQFSRDKFEDVADKYPGTPAAWWSKTVVGDMNLNEGTNLLYSDKPLGRDKLHSAVGDYESVLKDATESAVLQRATFGLARAHEALGELKEAREAYSNLVARWPTSALEEAARARVKDLDRPETKQFYDWFDKQNPGKSMLGAPGKPGEKPAFNLDTLDPHSKSLFPDDHNHDGHTHDGHAHPDLPDMPADDAPADDGGSADEPAAKGEPSTGAAEPNATDKAKPQPAVEK